MNKNTIDNDVRTIMDGASARVLSPRPGECLVCYVFRQLTEFGCNGTQRFARTFRDQTAPRATALFDRLRSMGACCCDGEIFGNVFRLSPNPWIIESGPFAAALGTPIRMITEVELERLEAGADPSEVTMTETKYLCCKIVRRGSTQPCGNWEHRPRR